MPPTYHGDSGDGQARICRGREEASAFLPRLRLVKGRRTPMMTYFEDIISPRSGIRRYDSNTILTKTRLFFKKEKECE